MAVNDVTEGMCDSVDIDRKSGTEEGLFRNVQKSQMDSTMDRESDET